MSFPRHQPDSLFAPHLQSMVKANSTDQHSDVGNRSSGFGTRISRSPRTYRRTRHRSITGRRRVSQPHSLDHDPSQSLEQVSVASILIGMHERRKQDFDDRGMGGQSLLFLPDAAADCLWRRRLGHHLMTSDPTIPLLTHGLPHRPHLCVPTLFCPCGAVTRPRSRS